MFRKHLYGPVITSVTPNHGSSAGGTSVTIAGRFFQGATSIKLGDVAIDSLSVVSDVEATGETGPHAVGAVDTKVTTRVLTTTKSGLFTYDTPSQIVNSCTPSHGPNNVPTFITISGSNFTGSDLVTVEAVPAYNVTVVDDNTITCYADVNPGFTGGCAVVVEESGTGRYGVGAIGIYTYDPS